ncbi:MarR family transcriptional regulator [Microbacterium sp. LjRoot45]|uniref:MarR family winged helix-turn-helix transcriptional regulator n=1 Tax=Microbacterium sp. LjRoot45 TaxID=3342329 RepID=UPI003ECDBEB4
MTSSATRVELLEELVRYETLLWNTVERGLSRAGSSSLATLLALRYLHQRESLGRVQDLAWRLGVTVGAASKIVDRLERDGLAVRRPHPDDRRSSLIALTPHGVRALADAETVAEDVLATVLPADADATKLGEVLRVVSVDLDSFGKGAT